MNFPLQPLTNKNAIDSIYMDWCKTWVCHDTVAWHSDSVTAPLYYREDARCRGWGAPDLAGAAPPAAAPGPAHGGGAEAGRGRGGAGQRVAEAGGEEDLRLLGRRGRGGGGEDQPRRSQGILLRGGGRLQQPLAAAHPARGLVVSRQGQDIPVSDYI